MSQNGPYSGPGWSSGDEPYAEPADPWGDHGTAVPESSSWGGHPPSIPQQAVGYHSAPLSPGGAQPGGPPAGAYPPRGGAQWNPVPAPPPRRNGPILALVVTLGVLIIIGLGTTGWLLKERNEQRADPVASATSTAPTVGGPAPRGSEDARFNVKAGDCVVNDGTPEKPEMRATPCTTGTYDVLQRIKGRTTGEKDAESKCAKVRGYTKWYFYDSPLDELDFVLCLKEHNGR